MTDNKFNVTVTQESGFNSDANQKQNVNIGEHFHLPLNKVYEKLATIHESNIVFDPGLLKEIIVTIDAGIQEILDEQLDFVTSINIDKKNELNNHSKEYFEQCVELDFYPQFFKLDKFFGLKGNQKTLQPKVDRIIKSLNRQIIAHQGSELFESILLKICLKLIDTHHDSLQGKENEILLVLYYFYCNCCIGKKTEEEKKNASS